MLDFKDIWECKSCYQDHLEIIIDELAVPLQLGADEFSYHYKCPVTGDSVYLTEEQYTVLEYQ